MALPKKAKTPFVASILAKCVGMALWLSVAVVAEVIPPIITSLVPADNSIHVLNGRQPLLLQFDEDVQKGAGNIAIKKADNSIAEAIAVTSSQVSVGDVALMHGFEAGTEEWTWGTGTTKTRDNAQAHSGSYSLKVVTTGASQLPEARYSPHDQDWSAFDSVITWVYTAEPLTSAVQFTRSGPGTVLGVLNNLKLTPLTPNAWTRLSSPISGATFPNQIKSYGLNFEDIGTYYVDDVGLKKAGSTYVAVIPSTNLVIDNGYYVTVDAGAFKDISNNNFAGIGAATTWNFLTNRTPTDIALSTGAVAENQASVTTVGTLSATDPDGVETNTYALVAGIGATDNASFSISGDSLLTGASLDYEAKASYSIRVQVSDNLSGIYEKVLIVTVTDVNEAPTITSATTASVAENSPAVQTATATDPDAVTTLVWSISGGADASLFAINSSSGALTFSTKPNFERPGDSGADNVYDVILQVSDGALVANQAVAVTISGANDAPAAGSGSAFTFKGEIGVFYGGSAAGLHLTTGTLEAWVKLSARLDNGDQLIIYKHNR